MNDEAIEWVDIVDQENQVIAQASRQQMRQQNLRHRASYIIVHDGMGRVLVQQRAENKDLYPGWMDIAAGGVLKAGEGMLQAARREAEEELGIADVPFADHGLFYFEDQHCRVWGGLFSCVSHGPFALQTEELTEVSWIPVKEIMRDSARFTPDSLKAFSIWVDRGERTDDAEFDS